MHINDVPRDTQVRVLQRLVKDHWTNERTARHLQLPYSTVDLVVRTYGPDGNRLAHALDELSNPLSPAPTPAPAAEPEPETTTSSPDRLALLTEGLASPSPRIRKKAERIEQLLEELAALLAAGREEAKRREKIAALEAQLAKLKGTSKGKGKGKWEKAADGTYHCPGPGCGRTFVNAQGVALHVKANPDHAEASA